MRCMLLAERLAVKMTIVARIGRCERGPIRYRRAASGASDRLEESADVERVFTRVTVKRRIQE